MKLFKEEYLSELLASDVSPCISVYMPTHRTHPENLQDPIKFKNLVKQLEKSLSEKYSNGEISGVLTPFYALTDNPEFWNYNQQGIAVFGSKEFFRAYTLHMGVSDLAVVANSFHTKPLRKYLQSMDRYYILGINLSEVKLFEGNRYSIAEVPLNDGIPKTLQEALGEELTEPHLTAAAYGGAGKGVSPMFHGHGSKKDEVDKDAERFFRIISNEIHEKISKPSALPLILATLPEHQNLFFKVSNNPYLLERAIDYVPDTVSAEKLVRLAWEVFEPQYVGELNRLSELFSQAQNDKLGSDSISEIANAIFEGRVEALLIESNKIVSGKFDPETGQIFEADFNHPDTDDLLDDLGEAAIKMGGQVKIFPPERMPVKTGIAAIYRY